MKAIQTSKHCNIICMYTAFTTTDSNPNKGLPDSMDVQNTGVHNIDQHHIYHSIHSQMWKKNADLISCKAWVNLCGQDYHLNATFFCIYAVCVCV